MTRAYREIYLSKVMMKMGEIFDSGIGIYDWSGPSFATLFVCSSTAEKIESGDVLSLLGRSGNELAHECIEEATGISFPMEERARYERSVSYWIGWILGYCQWRSCRSFARFLNDIPYGEWEEMYPLLHEMDIEKAYEIIMKRMPEKETNLKQIRSSYGCSQSRLSELSGVSLRSIQMYEQRQKDINKAESLTLFSLSRTLGCRMEDLLEF